MNLSIKDSLLKTLNESSGLVHIDPSTVSHVIDFNIDKKKNVITINFMTTYGQSLSLKVRFNRFKEWFSSSKEKIKSSAIIEFIKSFISRSKELEDEDEMMEIVDVNGDLYGDDDEPMNGTNSMVGMSSKDTDFVARRTVPKSVRMYSGDLGIGIITW